MAVDLEARYALVLAIAHEIGNHLGGIRLEAHLLGDDLDPRELARASVSLDGLAGRSGSLLSLIRPLLHPEASDPSAKPWSGVLAGAHQELLDLGTRGVDVSMDLSRLAPGNESLMAPPVGWLHPLLMAWLGASLAQVQAQRASWDRESNSMSAAAGPREPGFVRVTLLPGDAETRILFEDSAEEEDLSETAPRRERPLALAIARALLADVGGRVELDSEHKKAESVASGGSVRVVWRIPNAIRVE